MNQGGNILLKLPQLQNLIKRDPEAYREEFELQLRHYQTELQIFQLKPSNSSPRFNGLVTFMSHIAACYPVDMASFPGK